MSLQGFVLVGVVGMAIVLSRLPIEGEHGLVHVVNVSATCPGSARLLPPIT